MRRIVQGAAASLLVGLSAGCGDNEGQVPTFEVDAFWPMPLEYPNILGPVSGVTVAPDGKRLLVAVPLESETAPTLTLVSNWAEELR